MHRVKKWQKILSSRICREPKTILFMELQEIHKLSTDYGILSLIPEYLVHIMFAAIPHFFLFQEIKQEIILCMCCGGVDKN